MTVKIDFLISPRVVRAADEHALLGEVQQDEDSELVLSSAGSAVKLGMSMTVNCGSCCSRFAGVRLGNEQVPREEAVPRLLGDDANGSRYAGIGAGPAVLDEEFLAAQVREHAALEAVERRGVDRPVHLAPRDVLLARGLADDELVVGRTAGVLPGAADERTVGGDHALTPLDRFLVQRAARQDSNARAPHFRSPPPQVRLFRSATGMDTPAPSCTQNKHRILSFGNEPP